MHTSLACGGGLRHPNNTVFVHACTACQIDTGRGILHIGGLCVATCRHSAICFQPAEVMSHPREPFEGTIQQVTSRCQLMHPPGTQRTAATWEFISMKCQQHFPAGWGWGPDVRHVSPPGAHQAPRTCEDASQTHSCWGGCPTTCKQPRASPSSGRRGVVAVNEMLNWSQLEAALHVSARCRKQGYGEETLQRAIRAALLPLPLSASPQPWKFGWVQAGSISYRKMNSRRCCWYCHACCGEHLWGELQLRQVKGRTSLSPFFFFLTNRKESTQENPSSSSNPSLLARKSLFPHSNHRKWMNVYGAQHKNIASQP